MKGLKECPVCKGSKPEIFWSDLCKWCYTDLVRLEKTA